MVYIRLIFDVCTLPDLWCTETICRAKREADEEHPVNAERRSQEVYHRQSSSCSLPCASLISGLFAGSSSSILATKACTSRR
jgi:hypothetical protein